MSHFMTMVVGGVEQNMAPFHEYETTGVMDEFVEIVNTTDYNLQDYNNMSRTFLKNIETGELINSSHESEGYEEVKIPVNQYYDSFRSFLEDYCGIEVIYNSLEEAENSGDFLFEFMVIDDNNNVETYRATNPNAKWDYYVIGGRWSYRLITKNGEQVNSALKKDIDFDRMMEGEARKAENEYSEVEEFFGGEIPKIKTFQEFVNEGRREEYRKQEAVKQFDDFKNDNGLFLVSLDDYQMSKEEYIEDARRRSIVPFAFVKDRTWHEKAEMGWFGLTENEKSDWVDIFYDLLDSVNDNETITIVDCHI